MKTFLFALSISFVSTFAHAECEAPLVATECRHFSGYKPCKRGEICAKVACASYSAAGPRILFVHLGALGAVLRSTSLIAAVRRQYPDAVITWVTQSPAHALLAGVPDRILTTSPDDLLRLKALEFDVAMIVDKDLAAIGVAKSAKVGRVLGFTTDPASGGIVPATPAADKLWRIGLDDERKFHGNDESEQKLTHGALDLGPYLRDEYQIVFTPDEAELVAQRRRAYGDGHVVLGLNTGCSKALPAKRLTVEGHRELIRRVLADPRFSDVRIVLLGGGPEDAERNAAIARGLPVLETPTEGGLRDGLVTMAATDIVFSGDSLGMHMAIGLKKRVVAWFGPSVVEEIDFYDRGEAIKTKAPCSPCWKKNCGQPHMCYDQVDYDEVVEALARQLPASPNSQKRDRTSRATSAATSTGSTARVSTSSPTNGRARPRR